MPGAASRTKRCHPPDPLTKTGAQLRTIRCPYLRTSARLKHLSSRRFLRSVFAAVRRRRGDAAGRYLRIQACSFRRPYHL